MRDPADVAANAGRLVDEGYYVILTPNGTPWGAFAFARQAVERLAPEQRRYVVIAADPAAPPESGARRRMVFHGRDHVMRMTLYAIRAASLVVTVEGWMVHAAWCLGKPYRTLMLPYSHPMEWHPWLQSSGQGVWPVAGNSGSEDQSAAPLPSQPRKWVLGWVLPELGRVAGAPALDTLRWALQSRDRYIRQAAAEGLAACHTHCPNGATADLEELLSDHSHQVRGVAAASLIESAGRQEDSTLRAHIAIAREPRDWAMVYELGESARAALDRAASGDDPVIRREARSALRLLDFRRARQRAAQTADQADRVGRAPGLFGLLPSLFRRRPAASRPHVLILTPVKDAAVFLSHYCDQLLELDYPHHLLSLGLLESDSRDSSFAALEAEVPRLRRELLRAQLWKHDFGYRIPVGRPRWAEEIQMERRAVLARSRNQLLFRALDDEDWVLWLDSDVTEYPPDIIETLLATGRDIVQPHCVLDPGGPTFDKNAWRDQGCLHLDDLRAEGDLVELDAVGGTMLLVRADLHRDGLIFPATPYGAGDPRVPPGPGLLETEGLGILALHMGHRPWGLPHVEILHRKW